MSYEFNYDVDHFPSPNTVLDPHSYEFEYIPSIESVPSVTVKWKGSFNVQQLSLPHREAERVKGKPFRDLVFPKEKGGIYILEKRKRSSYVPIYVGESGIFGDRWQGRYDVIREMEVTHRYRVWIGIIEPEMDEREVRSRRRRKNLEAVFIRHLRINFGSTALTNHQFQKAAKIELGGSVLNAERKPSYIPSTIILTSGQSFEYRMG